MPSDVGRPGSGCAAAPVGRALRVHAAP